MAAISTGLERLGYGGSDGCIAVGQHRQVINDAVASRELLAKESGALCLFDRAAGVVYTLPAPVAGMQFEFRTTVSRTSNSHKVVTKNGTEFIIGSYMAGDSAVATSGDVFTGDGTTHRAITLDGDTKGGLVGGSLVFTAISSTQWSVKGDIVGTGTMVTAFTTS
jgi:hypothetical protein